MAPRAESCEICGTRISFPFQSIPSVPPGQPRVSVPWNATNVTVAPDGALYVSTGQGTPGRPIPGPQGRTEIVGEVLRITGYK